MLNNHKFKIITKTDIEKEQQAVPISEGPSQKFQKDRVSSSLVEIIDSIKGSLNREHQHFVLNDASRVGMGYDQVERKRLEDRINSEVKINVDKLENEAKSLGFQKGFEEGKALGLEEIRFQSKQDVDQVVKLLQSLNHIKDAVFSENMAFVVKIIIAGMKNVFQKEIKSDPEYLSRLVKTVIDQFKLKDHIKVQISKDDVLRLEKLTGKKISELDDWKNLDIQSLDTVSAGGCLIETNWNQIDATIETQFGEIEKSLLSSSKNVDPS